MNEPKRRNPAGLVSEVEAGGHPGPCGDPLREASLRRTFAIISHPDAGKTTLTEKFLLYSGVLTSGAGAVKSKDGGREVISDWMDLERRRGISITSTVLQFGYRGKVLNLLDTPGHSDFSEDTYRVLAAVDAAVMVLDGAKGIEAQTRKLFEVCREREIPIITFINKWDRPGRDPLELLDEIEEQLVLDPVPVTWPVGDGERFTGVIDRRTGDFVRFTRTVRGSTVAPEEVIAAGDVLSGVGARGVVGDGTGRASRVCASDDDAWVEAREAVELLDAVGADFDVKRFEAGELSPVFYGSALTNFGVGLLLDAVVDLVPSPVPRLDDEGDPRSLDAPFSAMAFKVQANMNPAHRDRVAFLRVCSGRFERGMAVINGRTGRTLSTKYAHSLMGRDRSTVDVAWPGDVIGLINAGELRPGDAVHLGPPVRWPAIPAFAPSCFRVAFCSDTAKAKQFRSGVRQLDSEGVVQVLHRPGDGEGRPILAAVGPMQFDVALHRLHREFGAPAEFTLAPWRSARRTDAASAEALCRMSGVTVARRLEGDLLALFDSPYWLERVKADNPGLVLERMAGEG